MVRFGRFIIRHSKVALFGFIAIVLASTFWGFQAFDLLKSGGYDDPGSDSARVTKILKTTFAQEPAELVAIADFKDSADAPANVVAGKQLQAEFAKISGVDRVDSYYSLGQQPSLKSVDGKAVYFFVNLKNDVVQTTVAREIQNRFDTTDRAACESAANCYDVPNATVHIAGFAAVSSELSTTIAHDLGKAEAVAIPLVILLLLFVFGSLVAAGLPLLVGGLSILGTFFIVWAAAQHSDTSIFVVNLATGLGIGLGIDYALLMVNRYREERARGIDVDAAVVATVASAGRTVLFSGLTVAIVLAAMGFFPQYFLKSFALGGIAVVALAVAAALVPLPALMHLLGDRINAGRLIKRDLTPKESGAWGSVSRFVMKRPIAVLLVTLIGLGGLASLAAGAQFGQVDDRILAKSDRVVVASNIVRERFNGREASPVDIVVRGGTASDIASYTIALSQVAHIQRVQSTAGIAQNGNLDTGYASLFADYSKDGYQHILAVHDIESRSPAGIDLTDAIRKLPAKGFSQIWVGGSAAIYTDSQLGITNNLPLVLGWIIGATLVLIFLFTGSVLLPIKAVILNFLSLGATLGVLTWIFIDGQFKWLLGDFIVTGTVDTSTLVLIGVVAFGLSMDYELFLLSRIKEQHDAGLGTTESVAVGLQRSGRIITAAALVLAVSFIAFISSSVTIIKMLGLGVAFAILLDATIVRGLLVPALMRLFGDLNWWAPKWLHWVHRKLGLED